MNRKISTLLTAGLLMAGSLCGSAWAGDVIPLSKAEDGGTYLLKPAYWYNTTEGWKALDEDNPTSASGYYYVMNNEGKVIVEQSTEPTVWKLRELGVAIAKTIDVLEV